MSRPLPAHARRQIERLERLLAVRLVRSSRRRVRRERTACIMIE